MLEVVLPKQVMEDDTRNRIFIPREIVVTIKYFIEYMDLYGF